jgi:predicted Zn finger-like uncharacterized protein
MIIACPTCETRYDLPESAIGPEGRTVRCAQCRHSWFQAGPESAPAVVLTGEEATLEGEGAAPATVTPAVFQEAPPFVSTDELPPDPALSPASEENDFGEASARRRRRAALLWLLALFLLFAGVIGTALAWYGTPDWLPIRHTALAAPTRTDLALDFPANRIERTTLPNGTEFFGAHGTVTNTGKTRRNVPAIEIVLRNANKQVVYHWDVVPPKSQLGPGESMTITEAVTDIPREARFPQIGWKAG